MDETMVQAYESLETADGLDAVEVWQGTENVSLPGDELSDSASQDMGEQGADSGFSQMPVSVPDVPASLDDEKVQAVVDAVLQSDQVNALMKTFQDTLQTVSYAVSVIQDESEDRQEPMEVVSVEEVLDRMTPQATVEQPLQFVSGLATSALAAAPAAAPAAVTGGEILVPGEEELTVVELVQTLLSYFQEDDNDLLTAIKNNTADIKTTVTEIAENAAAHPLMETPFEEYSVIEGILLLLVLWHMVLNPCICMIKGGFSWLTW